jgi:hypothetical protein
MSGGSAHGNRRDAWARCRAVTGRRSEPAEIMAIFVADSDCDALTIFDED